MKEYKKWSGVSRVEPKVDGVYARIEKDGARTKTGKPIQTVPHVTKALRKHFKKNPKSVVEGDLHRQGQSFEKTLGKFRGGRGKKLKLYVHGEDKPSRLTRHVKRVGGKVVKDEKGLQKVHEKHLRKSFEGSVVKRGGVARKMKPKFDEELPVVGSRLRKDGKAGVVSVKGKDGKIFKVQGSAGESARAKKGGRVTVIYQKSGGGAIRGGRLKAVRNRDFSYEFASARKSRRVLDAVKKVIKKTAKKVPKEVRRGAVLGSVVPFPGATVVGAGVGGAAVLKRAVENVVRKKTGRPYRMFDSAARVMNLQPKDVKQLKRDKIEKTRDVVDIASKVATAGAAVGAGVAVSKLAKSANSEIKRAGKAVTSAADRTSAKSVVGELGKRGKKHVKKAFPTVTRVARALTKHRKIRLESHEFAGRDQLKEKGSNRYVNPLHVASGQRTGYYVSDSKQKSVDLPVKHGQVIRAAYNKGKKIERIGGRAGRMARDAKDVVTGKERRKDAAGRKKKREWEKSWAKKAAGSALAGAGVLAYAGALKKNPNLRLKNKSANKVAKRVLGKNHNKKLRTVHNNTVRGARKRVNKVVPDTFADFSEIDAMIDNHLIEFDAARSAGWDVRDPRGRSARVFAPGSKTRSRRNKRWHEKAENERKLWKGAVVGGVVAGAALPKGVKAVKRTGNKVLAKRSAKKLLKDAAKKVVKFPNAG